MVAMDKGYDGINKAGTVWI